MSARAIQVDEIDVIVDEDLEVLEESGTMRRATPPVPPPRHLIERAYEDIEDDQHSTAANELISQFARLSNPNAIPRRLKNDLAGLSLNPKAAFLLSRI